MVGTNSWIGSVFLLAVSLIGNVEQRKQLGLRSTQIEELKWENQALVNSANLNQEQLMQLKKEYEQANDQQLQLLKDLNILRSQKDTAEKDVAVFQEQLRGKELSEERRLQLERELAKANAKLEIQEEMVREKINDVAETREHLHQLSMNQCGSFTPQGLLKMVSDWANVSPWTISILGNVVFSAIAAFLWRLFWYAHRPRQTVMISDNQDIMLVPIYDWWPIYWLRKLVTWLVAFLALSILPVMLKDFAGRKAMDSMEAARASFCEGRPWCAWGFDTFLTPNAILIAEGEAYVHAARGWQRVAMAQVLALASDWLIVLMICAVSWPFRKKAGLALQHNEKKLQLE